jgi:hypothetical protein
MRDFRYLLGANRCVGRFELGHARPFKVNRVRDLALAEAFGLPDGLKKLADPCEHYPLYHFTIHSSTLIDKKYIHNNKLNIFTLTGIYDNNVI